MFAAFYGRTWGRGIRGSWLVSFVGIVLRRIIRRFFPVWFRSRIVNRAKLLFGYAVAAEQFGFGLA
ncbi:MAG: hypothetical protein DMF06_08600 [Verrucomicrobia bacterium]|nr:MAG: hypothetical protein DMF06_08600 [Verrucomicrobiota bacterium]